MISDTVYTYIFIILLFIYSNMKHDKPIDFQNIDIDETDSNMVDDSPLTDKEFVKFLREYGIYNTFMREIRRYNERNPLFYVDTEILCENIEKKYYISAAFNWDRTDDGFKFWDFYNDLWDEKIKNTYNEKVNHNKFIVKNFDVFAKLNDSINWDDTDSEETPSYNPGLIDLDRELKNQKLNPQRPDNIIIVHLNTDYLSEFERIVKAYGKNPLSRNGRYYDPTGKFAYFYIDTDSLITYMPYEKAEEYNRNEHRGKKIIEIL